MSDIENSDSDSYNSESESDFDSESEENKLPTIKKVITNNTDDLEDEDEVDEVEVELEEEEEDNKAFGVDQNDDNSDYEYNSNAEDEDEDEDEDEPSRKKSKTKQTINLGNQSVNKSFDLNYDKDDDEEEDDDDDDDEHYLQKFNSDINKTYISEFHPECIIHNYEEVSALSHVVRDNNGIIVDDLHKTIPFLTKYERARILGQRAKQIECGAKPFVKVPDNIVDSYIIAELELKQKKIPFVIRRPIPNGGCEYWNLKDLEMIHF